MGEALGIWKGMGLLPRKAVAWLGSSEWPNNDVEAGTVRKEVKELDPMLPTGGKPLPFLRASQPWPVPALAYNGLVWATPPPLPSGPLRKKYVNMIKKKTTTHHIKRKSRRPTENRVFNTRLRLVGNRCLTKPGKL